MEELPDSIPPESARGVSRVARWLERIPGRLSWGRELAIRRLRGTFLHRYLAPNLLEISRHVECQSSNSQRVLQSVFNIAPKELVELRSEFLELFNGSKPPEVGANLKLDYPEEFQFDQELSLPLYQLVRFLKPKSVVETGVADGRSTSTILAALGRNGSGHLKSFDISERVGELVPEDLRDRWQLIVLPRTGTARAFRQAIERGGILDLFLHDSDHRYSWHLFELLSVWPHLAANGVLVSDDVDSSFAFVDFGRSHGRMRAALVGDKKVAGVILK